MVLPVRSSWLPQGECQQTVARWMRVWDHRPNLTIWCFKSKTRDLTDICLGTLAVDPHRRNVKYRDVNQQCRGPGGGRRELAREMCFSLLSLLHERCYRTQLACMSSESIHTYSRHGYNSRCGGSILTIKFSEQVILDSRLYSSKFFTGYPHMKSSDKFNWHFEEISRPL